MSDTGLVVFDRTLQKSNTLINDFAAEVGIEDKHIAFQGLRAVFCALRDRLPLEEAVQLGAQLPILVAGFYYHGWKPAATPTKERSLEDFLAKVRTNLNNDNYPITIEALVKGTFVTLNKWITAGEMEDVTQMLPAEVQSFLPETVSK